MKITDEKFIQYIWVQKLYNTEQKTIMGEQVEIISTGIINRDAGPDVFNAKIKIGDKIWVGNVEFHLRASDWNRHNHTHDPNYTNTILHVVLEADEQILRNNGEYIPTIILHYPEHLNQKFLEMQNKKEICRCCKNTTIAEAIDPFRLNSWLDRLLIERLESKTNLLENILKRSANDWQQAFFVILARGFGFSTNADAMQAIAESIPFHIILHHRDNIEQIEALLLGQGGLLNINSDDKQIQCWQREYNFLKKKYNLSQINVHLKFMRMRPQGFPTSRIAQLAMLLHKNDHLLSCIIEAQTAKSLYKTLKQNTSEFWHTHYTLKDDSSYRHCVITRQSMDLIIINSVVPFIFYYGRKLQKEELEEKAIKLLQSLRGENNYIVKLFAEEGIKCNSAYDSQAIIQLYKNYCTTNKCLQCAIGYEMLKTE